MTSSWAAMSICLRIGRLCRQICSESHLLVWQPTKLNAGCCTWVKTAPCQTTRLEKHDWKAASRKGLSYTHFLFIKNFFNTVTENSNTQKVSVPDFCHRTFFCPVEENIQSIFLTVLFGQVHSLVQLSSTGAAISLKHRKLKIAEKWDSISKEKKIPLLSKILLFFIFDKVDWEKHRDL